MHPLICVGCSVHYWVSCAINNGTFSRLHFLRHTFASLSGDCLRFASLWWANSRGDSSVLSVHFSNVFWGVLFVFVTRTYFKSFLRVYYRFEFIESSKVVFWKFVRLLVHASMKLGCLSRRTLLPQSKSTELCISAAVVPQSKSTAMWRSAAPFHHHLWYFWHRTNEHFSSMLFIRKNLQ